MNHVRQARFWIACCIAGLMAGFQAAAQNVLSTPPPLSLSPGTANIMPPKHSPVDFFRQLLAMTPDEREQYLKNHPPETRARILAKVQEYLEMDPNERELRLRATELRWYLMPLMQTAPTNRATELANVPDNLRDLVVSRLRQWDILPPPIQQEFLNNEDTLAYFSHVDPSASANGNGAAQSAVNGQPGGMPLTDSQRRRISEQFEKFFQLTQLEEQKTLNTLSDAERAQMEKTLQTFGNLSPQQRSECIRAYTKFAAMPPQDRAEFLKNAERWSQMSPKERQAWRDLVAQVPQWPPMPQIFFSPPMPPTPPHPAAQSPSQPSGPLVATNHN